MTHDEMITKPNEFKWSLGKRVKKKSGSWWEGRIVGFYSTEQTPAGYNVQLEKPNGPVQIYPENSLELIEENKMTIDIKDLKIGDEILVKMTVISTGDKKGEHRGTLRCAIGSQGSVYVAHVDDIHSILPREPQVDEVWLDRSTNTAFTIMCTSNDSFVGKFNNGKLFIGVLSEVVKRFKFVPTEQHKDYGFE